MTTQVPIVDYLALGDDPHLVAQECNSCSAIFFDRRNACASCGSDAGFSSRAIPTEGVLKTFTIVSFAAPGVPVPFVAALVDCGGVSVRGNVVNVEPVPEQIQQGMRLRLTTVAMGTDSAGTEALGFGFEPIESGAL